MVQRGGMLEAHTIVGLVTFAVVVPLAMMFAIAWRHAESPGSRGFLVVLVGAALWSGAAGIMVLAGSRTAFDVTWGARLLGANLLATGWLVMALDYTRRREVSLGRIGWVGLLVVPLVGQLLFLTNDAHHLVVGPETSVSAVGGVVIEHGPWFALHSLYNLSLLAIGTGLLVRDAASANGIHRTQIGVLILGLMLALPASLGYLLEFPVPNDVDLAPFGFLLTMGLWTGALFRFDLFAMVPVARRTALDTIPDTILIVDRDGRIVDINRTGLSVFGLSAVPTGTSIESFFGEYPELVDRFEVGEASTDEVSVVFQGTVRHLSVTMRPIEYRGSTTGSVLLLRDISNVRARGQDLETVRNLLSRVLRHNLRTDLQLVEAHARELSEGDGPVDERAEAILEVTENLLRTSEKAQRIEAIIDSDTERTVHDLRTIVRGASDRLVGRYPEASIEQAVPPDTWVLAHEELPTAVENLIENAIIHGCRSDESVRIEVTSTDGRVILDVIDDGPGIPDHEVAALDGQESSALEHGSGAGLWLVNWIAEKSGGSLSFVVENGTTASLELERVDAIDQSSSGSSPVES